MVKVIIGGDFRAKETRDLCFASELAELLKSSDIRVCNFEAPIEVGAPKALKAGPSIDQNADSAQFLLKSGFDVVLLANNHVMDRVICPIRNVLKGLFGLINNHNALKIQRLQERQQPF